MPEAPFTFHPLYAFAVFALIILFVRSLRSSSKKTSFKAYRLKPSLLTATELKFYKTLVNCVPANHTLLIKPRIADYVKVSPFDQASFNRISAKHVDFLLCNSQSLAPVLGIELDDSSHNTRIARLRDAFVETLYKRVSLPLYRVKTAKTYNLSVIKGEISKLIR